MLQIRLNKPSSLKDGVGGVSGGVSGGTKPVPLDSVTVACPDHLVIAALPVAKSLGVVPSAPVVKNVGRKSRCLVGECVHFCVRCDFPIAVYGRLTSCGHAFCLDCARSDSTCYLCEERILKIQTVKMMEDIYICGAAHCFKTFLRKPEFDSHILENHRDLQPNSERGDGKESEAMRSSKPTLSDSTVQMPTRPGFSTGPNAQSNDMSKHQQVPELQQLGVFFQQRPQGPPIFFGQMPNLQPPQQVEYTTLHAQQPPNYPMFVATNNALPHHPLLPYPSYVAPEAKYYF